LVRRPRSRQDEFDPSIAQRDVENNEIGLSGFEIAQGVLVPESGLDIEIE